MEDIHAGRPAGGVSLRQIPTGGADLGENTEMCDLRKADRRHHRTGAHCQLFLPSGFHSALCPGIC